MYFEDLDKIKENIPLNTAKLGSKDPNIFKAQKLVLAFYKNWN
jgi:hypothetical protein